MEILRVETFAKTGLYLSKCKRPSTDWSIHPLPSDDELIGEFWRGLAIERREKWHFGFKDMNQLVRWWPDWEFMREHNDKLDESDPRRLGISTYDVDEDDLNIGDTQVIFLIDRSERLKFEPFERTHRVTLEKT